MAKHKEKKGQKKEEDDGLWQKVVNSLAHRGSHAGEIYFKSQSEKLQQKTSSLTTKKPKGKIKWYVQDKLG